MAMVHLDDGLYGRLKVRAEARGSSVEDDVRRILDGEAPPPKSGSERRAALLDLIDRSRERPLYLDGRVPDSTELIRQMREEEEFDLMRVVRGER